MVVNSTIATQCVKKEVTYPQKWPMLNINFEIVLGWTDILLHTLKTTTFLLARTHLSKYPTFVMKKVYTIKSYDEVLQAGTVVVTPEGCGNLNQTCHGR